MNIYVVNDVTKTEKHTAKPLVPESSASDIELATEKLKNSQTTRYSSNSSRND
jgi:hypothetical protein